MNTLLWIVIILVAAYGAKVVIDWFFQNSQAKTFAYIIAGIIFLFALFNAVGFGPFR